MKRKRDTLSKRMTDQCRINRPRHERYGTGASRSRLRCAFLCGKDDQASLVHSAAAGEKTNCDKCDQIKRS